MYVYTYIYYCYTYTICHLYSLVPTCQYSETLLSFVTNNWIDTKVPKCQTAVYKQIVYLYIRI